MDNGLVWTYHQRGEVAIPSRPISGGDHMRNLFVDQLIGYGCFIALLLSGMYFWFRNDEKK